jgi:hypothetical protein
MSAILVTAKVKAGIMSAKVVSCSNINGYLRNYQDCLTLEHNCGERLRDCITL